MTGAEGEPAGLGLYLHVPFCAHRCHYCDYAVHASARPPVGAWLEAVERELELRFRAEGWSSPPGPPRLATVYVGGGTPSALGAGGVERLAEVLASRFDAGPVGEWTVEANPEDVDRTTVRRWLRAGVTRITLGVQSFDGRALRWLGRLHDPSDARRAVETVREAEPESLGIDLLYGLPERLERHWEEDLERVRELEIPHVTLYGLSAEDGTPLGRWARAGRSAPAGEASKARDFLRASRLLRAGGWEHYEVTGLALPGNRSRHNLRYWNGEPTLGLGPSAHSFLPPRRSWNVADWHEYRKCIAGGGSPVEGRERPSGSERRAERIWLRLRTRDGIDGPLARRLRDAGPELVGRLVEEGWLQDETAAVAATPEGWLRLDDLAAALASVLDRTTSTSTPGPRRTSRPRENDRRDAIR